MANVSDIGYGSFKLNLNDENAIYTKIYLYEEGDSGEDYLYYDSVDWGSGEIQFWGWEQNTRYYFRVIANYESEGDESGGSVTEETNVFSTLHITAPTINYVSATKNSVTLKRVNNSVGDLATFILFQKNGDESPQWHSVSVLADIYTDTTSSELPYTLSRDDLTVSGLNSGTWYFFYCVNIYKETAFGEISYIYGDQSIILPLATTYDDITRPQNWTWSSTISAGTSIASLKWDTDWNSFVDRVNSFITYYYTNKGTSYVMLQNRITDPNLGTINLKMSSTDKILYASRFNAVNLAISQMSSTGISDKSKGDKLYASYLNTLRDSLNAIT